MASTPAPLTVAPRAPLLAFIACAGGMMFFGAMDSAMKAVTIDIGVIAALFWRCLIGSALAGALFWWKGNRRLPRGAARCSHRCSALAGCW